jgi:COMPASS component SPP1
MADHEAAADGDVEMGGTDLGVGHDNPASTDALDSTGKASNPNNTSSSFAIKPDPDQKHLPPTSSPAESAKTKSAPKKKGTAATTKKTPKRSKGPKSSKRKSSTAAREKAGGDENEGSSDDETDNGPYCLCRGPDDHRWMISCDVCEDWFHGECVNLEKEIGEKLVERFVCPNCTDGKRNYTKYRKTCSLPSCMNAARLYTKDAKDRSVFCSNEHCDAWWASMITTLPTKAASKKALQVLTQEDFLGLVSATANAGGWKLGDKPFGTFTLLLRNIYSTPICTSSLFPPCNRHHARILNAIFVLILITPRNRQHRRPLVQRPAYAPRCPE